MINSNNNNPLMDVLYMISGVYGFFRGRQLGLKKDLMNMS